MVYIGISHIISLCASGESELDREVENRQKQLQSHKTE